MGIIMDFMFEFWLGKPIWAWIGFLSVVVALLAFDLGILSGKRHDVTIKESLALSAFYITLGLAFGGWVYWYFGPDAGLNYVTGFVVEKTLAIDNVFVIALIFSFFAIPLADQRRVLFWGILGVVVLRGIMIGVGATLVHQFEWLLYLFAVFLMFTGIKMLVGSEKEMDLASNPVITFLKKHLRVTDKLHGERFVVRLVDPNTNKRALYVTPLLLALIMIELADVVFAVDSIPAIFAITTDPFIAYTSNIFAILGLRALYFALAAMIHRFEYLKQALAILLIFIGSKLFVADLLGLEKFPAIVSLSLTFAILAGGIILSLLRTKADRHHATEENTV
jgi:tellurite resistance protein TerC